jgi:serine/threonine protein kinase
VIYLNVLMRVQLVPYLDSSIPLHIAKRIFAQVLLACEYLASKNIVHRDIKDEVNYQFIKNIVVDANYHIKLIDFGSASYIPKEKEDYFKNYNGTPHFAPPEIVRGHAYQGPQAEIW